MLSVSLEVLTRTEIPEVHGPGRGRATLSPPDKEIICIVSIIIIIIIIVIITVIIK